MNKKTLNSVLILLLSTLFANNASAKCGTHKVHGVNVWYGPCGGIGKDIIDMTSVALNNPACQRDLVKSYALSDTCGAAIETGGVLLIGAGTACSMASQQINETIKTYKVKTKDSNIQSGPEDCRKFGKVFEATIHNTSHHSGDNAGEQAWARNSCLNDNDARIKEVLIETLETWAMRDPKDVGPWYAAIESAAGNPNDEHGRWAYYRHANGDYWSHIVNEGIFPALYQYWNGVH